jgi:hypothetical protein
MRMRSGLISAMATLSLLTVADTSGAQPVLTTSNTPTVEVSAALGTFGLSPHQPSGIGVHVTRNYSPVVALEVGVTGEQTNSERPGHVLVTVDGRFQAPDFITGRSAFLTVGIGRASGLTYRYSPLIGLGIQRTIHDPLLGTWFGLRLELQQFVNGERRRDRTRLLLGALVGF